MRSITPEVCLGITVAFGILVCVCKVAQWHADSKHDAYMKAVMKGKMDVDDIRKAEGNDGRKR